MPNSRYETENVDGPVHFEGPECKEVIKEILDSCQK